MMYSGIKLMALCLAYRFRMRVSLGEAEALRNPTTHAAKSSSSSHFGCVCTTGKVVWLVGSIVNLQTFDHIVWVFGILPSALCIMTHQL